MNNIKSEIIKKIGIITFDNDKKKNSFSKEMLNELLETFKNFKEQNLSVVILRSNSGSSVWSAGLNIEELPQSGIDPLPYEHPLEKLMRVIQNFPGPVIAMAEGSIWGGACDLAFVCDIVIGTQKTTFAITPAKIGIPYNTTGLLHFVENLSMHIVKEIFFTAQPISAKEAHNHGVLNHIVEKEELESYTYKMAERISRNSPLSIKVIKEQLNILGGSRSITPETFERINQLRSEAYNSNDYKEGILSFLEKRHAKFTGK